MRIAVVLPALDEEGSVGPTVRGFRAQGARVVVADNGSTDRTAERARDAGATVVTESRRGYGTACIAGLRLLADDPPDVVVFADCDGTSDPGELGPLVAPIKRGAADLVLGRRTRLDPRSLPWKNRIARGVVRVTFRVLFGLRIHDLGPYRAVRWTTVAALRLSHPTFGLPVETVARAARLGARVTEVDVSYRNRLAGTSKVGRHVGESLLVGLVMVLVPLRIRFARRT